MRVFRIPTVTDRILQRAVMQQLQPLFNSYFHEGSFGCRPKLGIKDAFPYITNLRRQGYTFVLDGNIDDFSKSLYINLCADLTA